MIGLPGKLERWCFCGSNGAVAVKVFKPPWWSLKVGKETRTMWIIVSFERDGRLWMTGLVHGSSVGQVEWLVVG